MYVYIYTYTYKSISWVYLTKNQMVTDLMDFLSDFSLIPWKSIDRNPMEIPVTFSYLQRKYIPLMSK